MTDAYIKDGVSGENRRPKQVTYVVGSVSWKVHNAASMVSELKLLVILKVHVEGTRQHHWIVKAVDRGKRLLYLCNALADTHRDVIRKTGLEISGGSKMVSVCVRLPENDADQCLLSGISSSVKEGLQDVRYRQPTLSDEGKQSVSSLR